VATEHSVYDESFIAGADLSGKQFYAVKISAARTVALGAAATDRCIGILQNDPASGQAAVVRMIGLSKAISGAAVTVGAEVTSDAAGKLIDVAGATGRCVGVAVEATTGADQLFTLFVFTGSAKAGSDS
jgi:hypothetical protein